MEKICPLTKEKCNPFDENQANKNCSFYINDMFKSGCIYVDALKSFPQILEAIKKIKGPSV
jgi:hypothetical protein